ncbi:hypothetical protein AUC68_08835 [Methyloceanibacter methanicus]|uniref:Methyltransferase type 11 domain-containing protein n=1 Tax=Methyloceanibacter methanicus TaxID=1774968 RepID=A0A1E3VYA0_9HYPH|nr:hypothetical protein AUC68_08835 [Methyloceanibacter methanicus]
MFLFERLNIRDIFLLDKTDMESQIWYMFEQKGAFYNSLDLAKETLTINGVDPSIVKLIEAPSNGEIPLEEKSIDLVLSTISWGFHYPVSTYIDSVAKILSDDGVLIIDVRKGTDGVAELQNHFKVSVIEEIGKIQTVKCTKEIA